MQHISSGPIPFRVKPGLQVTYDYLKDPNPNSAEMMKWRYFGTGGYASMPYTSTAFLRSTDIP